MSPLSNTLQRWAERWGLSPECVADLMQSVGAGGSPPPPAPPLSGNSEAWAQSVVRLEAPRHGIWMTRNNVGVLPDRTGRPVRYGLANESKPQNEAIKSADLIGIRPVVITRAHVGQTIGQFVSRECKRPGWTYKGGPHEEAQLNWALLVTRYGGDAKFTTGAGSFDPS